MDAKGARALKARIEAEAASRQSGAAPPLVEPSRANGDAETVGEAGLPRRPVERLIAFLSGR